MAIIDDLINQVADKALRERLRQEADRMSKHKKFGLVFEEHIPECTPLYEIPVKKGSHVAVKGKNVQEIFLVVAITNTTAKCINKITKKECEYPILDLVSIAQFGDPIYPQLIPVDAVENAPDSNLWHTLIEADNYHALQLLEYLYPQKVDCIYIDPPYNTGARDWKYNNDYVDDSDAYRHSKWLSMMQKRLKIAKCCTATTLYFQHLMVFEKLTLVLIHIFYLLSQSSVLIPVHPYTVLLHDLAHIYALLHKQKELGLFCVLQGFAILYIEKEVLISTL